MVIGLQTQLDEIHSVKDMDTFRTALFESLARLPQLLDEDGKRLHYPPLASSSGQPVAKRKQLR